MRIMPAVSRLTLSELDELKKLFTRAKESHGSVFGLTTNDIELAFSENFFKGNVKKQIYGSAIYFSGIQVNPIIELIDDAIAKQEDFWKERI